MLNFEHRTSKEPPLRGFCETFAWEIGAREGAICGGKLKKIKMSVEVSVISVDKNKKQRSQQPSADYNSQTIYTD